MGHAHVNNCFNSLIHIENRTSELGCRKGVGINYKKWRIRGFLSSSIRGVPLRQWAAPTLFPYLMIKYSNVEYRKGWIDKPTEIFAPGTGDCLNYPASRFIVFFRIAVFSEHLAVRWCSPPLAALRGSREEPRARVFPSQEPYGDVKAFSEFITLPHNMILPLYRQENGC